MRIPLACIELFNPKLFDDLNYREFLIVATFSDQYSIYGIDFCAGIAIYPVLCERIKRHFFIVPVWFVAIANSDQRLVTYTAATRLRGWLVVQCEHSRRKTVMSQFTAYRNSQHLIFYPEDTMLSW